MKSRLIWIYLCLKLVFENSPAAAAAARLWTARESFEVLPTSWCRLWHPKCDDAMHLALPHSHCKPVHLSLPIHNNPVGLTLNYSCWCVFHNNLSYFCLTSNNLNPTGSIHLASAWFITKTAMQLFPSSVDSTGLVSGSTVRGSVWGIWYTARILTYV